MAASFVTSSLHLGHIATAMLPLCNNELTERCYHFGLTFVMKHPLNILFLGGAKRVSMARKLIAAGQRRGVSMNLFSYELHAEVPVAELARVITGRKFNAPDILDHLHTIVELYSIDVLIPFVDPAVGVAARYVETYGNVVAPVVSSTLAETLFDKSSAARAFEEASLPIPSTYKSGRPRFPLIAKPRYGSASRGIEVIETITDFRRIIARRDEFLIQDFIPDHDEFTVDCYVARGGEIMCISPRRRLEVLGGEVVRTVTIDSPALVEASRMAIERLGLSGALTLQYLSPREEPDRLMLMEINPRLGGGAVCTVHAGGDLPGYILDEALGLPMHPAPCIKPGTLICRYFQEVAFFNEQ